MVLEKSQQSQLPIFTMGRQYLKPPKGDFRHLDALAASQNANIRSPQMANFFKLQPPTYQKDPSPSALRPSLARRRPQQPLPLPPSGSPSSPLFNPLRSHSTQISGLEPVSEKLDKTYGFVNGGNEQKQLAQI